MNRVSDERLERLIELWRPEATGTGDFGEATELCVALRELRDYRKAVSEYLREVDRVNSLAKTAAYRKALATLRALKESDE